MSPEPFDTDMLGFVANLVGMAVCVAGGVIWSL